MASLETTIRNTQTLQDIELAEAMKRLKSNPSELRAWLQSQQDRVYRDIVQQKENTFNKVYGDFHRASKVEESILMHNKRSQELSDMVDQVYQNQEASASAVLQDKALATRKNEMNEWTVGNKQDTLFVFSSLFLLLSGLLFLTAIWRLGLIRSSLWVSFAIPLVIIFLLILFRRWRYTDVLRNKRYWNKQIFEGKRKKITLPSCPEIVGAVSDGMGQGLGQGQGVQGANVASPPL
jgi:hypothetical protein